MAIWTQLVIKVARSNYYLSAKLPLKNYITSEGAVSHNVLFKVNDNLSGRTSTLEYWVVGSNPT